MSDNVRRGMITGRWDISSIVLYLAITVIVAGMLTAVAGQSLVYAAASTGNRNSMGPELVLLGLFICFVPGFTLFGAWWWIDSMIHPTSTHVPSAEELACRAARYLPLHERWRVTQDLATPKQEGQ